MEAGAPGPVASMGQQSIPTGDLVESPQKAMPVVCGCEVRSSAVPPRAPPTVRWVPAGTRSPRVRGQIHECVGLRDVSRPSHPDSSQLPAKDISLSGRTLEGQTELGAERQYV